MFLRRYKEKKNAIKAARKILKFYAEGSISVYDFWDEFNNNDDLKDLIYKDKLLPIKNKPFLYEDINLDLLYHRCEIFRVVKCYFLRRNIAINFYNEDELIYKEILDIIPSYVDVGSVWFYDNIIKQCSYSIGTKERKEYLLKCVKNRYRYVNKPPKWLHDPEWPIGEGGPLIFISQKGNPNSINCNEIKYLFHDELANSDLFVIQCD